MFQRPVLVVIAGPTAIGKTALSIDLAAGFSSEIISVDSRQFYKELKIGSAQPSAEELSRIPHHFIAERSVTEEYNVASFEKDALTRLDQLFEKHRIIFACGGSGLYIDALCNGLDEVPLADQVVRQRLETELEEKGLEALAEKIKVKDSESYETIDLKNPRRVIRALEIMELTGRKASELRKKKKKERPFEIVKILLDIPRENLYQRINKRVDQMMEQGLLKEAENLFPLRHLNALQTVGYRELFLFLEGSYSLERAVELIKQNTRRYAKRQLTWFRNDEEYKVFSPEQEKEIINYIKEKCGA